MTTYYVGPGGNDSNDGLTWANRFLTLNGAEDEPVAAGDTVWVGPGVYREQLTIDVDGTSVNTIKYYADVTGVYTDGIGGIVRVTGSDDDQTDTRDYAILGDTKDYRTFRSFYFDTTDQEILRLLDCENIIVEDCVLGARTESTNDASIHVTGTSQGQTTIRRCLFLPSSHAHIDFYSSSDVSDLGHVVENCVFMGGTDGILINNVGGVTIRNCTLAGLKNGVFIEALPASGQTITVNNSIITGCQVGLSGNTTGYLVEDYNSFYANQVNRIQTATGSNSVNSTPLLQPPILRNNLELPWSPYSLSQWSSILGITGASEPADDLYGIDRPATASKNSWGGIQYIPVDRETTTYNSAPTSIELSDAGTVRFIVPNSGNQTTVKVQVYREANYAGTLPQLRVVYNGGYSTSYDTDTGSASQWNELSINSGGGGWTGNFLQIELGSLNTATSGSYAIYFDDLTIDSP